MLNWFYDRSLEGGIEMKATCAPHYFRVVRQRRALEHRSETAAAQAVQLGGAPPSAHIGPTEMVMARIDWCRTKAPRSRSAGWPSRFSSIRHECHDQGLLENRAEARPLVIVDIAMPRDIDPAVREVKGIYLYDLDDLEVVADHKAVEHAAAALEAQKILHAEAQGFCHKLMAERVIPTIVALRSRLDEICRQELESFKQEREPFSKDQDEMLNAVLSRMTQRIAGSLARELKELPEKVQQEQRTTASQRLIHLPPAEKTIAGTKSAQRLATPRQRVRGTKITPTRRVDPATSAAARQFPYRRRRISSERPFLPALAGSPPATPRYPPAFADKPSPLL
jgi:hypothetical protein